MGLSAPKVTLHTAEQALSPPRPLTPPRPLACLLCPRGVAELLGQLEPCQIAGQREKGVSHSLHFGV